MVQSLPCVQLRPLLEFAGSEQMNRSAERARQRWHEGHDEQAAESLIHAQQVVGQLLAGLRYDVDSDLVKRVAGVYLFVFRTLMEANYERNQSKLDDAIRVLQSERETWRQVCKRLAGRTGPPPPHLPSDSAIPEHLANPGLSLEA